MWIMCNKIVVSDPGTQFGDAFWCSLGSPERTWCVISQG